MPFEIQRSGGHSETSPDGRWSLEISDAWAESPEAYAEILLRDLYATPPHDKHPYLYLRMPCENFDARSPDTTVRFGSQGISIQLSATPPVRVEISQEYGLVGIQQVREMEWFQTSTATHAAVGLGGLVLGLTCAFLLAGRLLNKQTTREPAENPK